MNKFNTLYDFIDSAVRSRKYAENTGGGLKAALKLFEAELHEEEKASIDKFRTNIEQIYKSVFSKNIKSFSASSLATYKSRVLKVLGDYEKYGVDPTKMASWSPRASTPRTKKTSHMPKADDQDGNIENGDHVLGDMHRVTLSLRPGIRAAVVVPMDMTKAECTKLKNLLDSLSVE